EMRERLVTLDARPFVCIDKPLRWICEKIPGQKASMALQLITAEGEAVTHSLRILPGVSDLYMSDETIFPGPESWLEDTTEIQPYYEVPTEVLESESGVEFLGCIGADLPAYLRKRVDDEVLLVTLKMKLSASARGAQSENLLVEVTASDVRGTRQEVLGKGGWSVTEQHQGGKNRIMRYNRNALHRFPRWLEPMMLNYDASLEGFKARVTRNFPERFTQWVGSFSDDILIEADEALTTLMNDPVKASVSFEVTEKEIDWFDLKVVVDVEGLDLSPEEVRSLVAARGGFVRLKEGGWLRLEIDMEDRQKEAVARLGLDPFDLTGETHRMHVLQLAEPLAKEVFDAKAWEKIRHRAASIKLQVRPQLPKGLNVDFRPYQIEGFHFLAYLSTNRFGGILADDMGLGKTVQALAWLMWLRSRAEGKRTALVVCPKSVLDVWAGEVKKFAPELEVQVLRNKSELDIERVEKEIDLLVINYSQLRVCSENLQKVNWLAMILDEGQQIKNPDSKAAKTARQLVGENRLVLTGTPIENRLLDVWSLMAFAMPGVLGDRKYFREHFDRRKDPESQIRLAARLRPFLLRRAKGQVAMDLPPRTEEDVLCKMEGIQEELYAEQLRKIQGVILDTDSEEGVGKNRFIILQGLMRLRQICCHPALIDRTHIGEESAKLTALFYLLDQLREEGHKVLVFSQFVTMLNIIRDRLEEEERPFHYLTGQTKDRQRVIEDFQTAKEASVFLLSLKAGGSGLNLTAASYVVLYDPW
ncbi:MAG: DEAD/DEAH box helicase, partial [Verrucomicrobiales bacterium]